MWNILNSLVKIKLFIYLKAKSLLLDEQAEFKL